MFGLESWSGFDPCIRDRNYQAAVQAAALAVEQATVLVVVLAPVGRRVRIGAGGERRWLTAPDGPNPKRSAHPSAR